MKLKEVVSILTEYAKVAGDDCEVQLSEIRLNARVTEDWSEPYRHYSNRPKKIQYFVVATEYARPPKFETSDEVVSQ